MVLNISVYNIIEKLNNYLDNRYACKFNVELLYDRCLIEYYSDKSNKSFIKPWENLLHGLKHFNELHNTANDFLFYITCCSAESSSTIMTVHLLFYVDKTTNMVNCLTVYTVDNTSYVLGITNLVRTDNPDMERGIIYAVKQIVNNCYDGEIKFNI